MWKRKHLVQVVVVLGLAASALAQDPVGTVFTYQGSLSLKGNPLTGKADFQLTLWDAPTGGEQIGPMVPKNNVQVEDGLFILQVPFGVEAYTPNERRWLKIAVRSPAGSGQFTVLDPREELTATPFSTSTRGISVDVDGNVGLGTSTPTAKLHVKGDLRVGNSIWLHHKTDEITTTSGTVTFTGTNVVVPDANILTAPGKTLPGWIGIREGAPYTPLHVKNLDIPLVFNGLLYEEDAVVEDKKAWLGLYSREEELWLSSGITLAEVTGNNVGDKWSIFRTDTPNTTDLHVTYGDQVDPHNNTMMMRISQVGDTLLAPEMGDAGIGLLGDPLAKLQVVEEGLTSEYATCLSGEDVIVEDDAFAWLGLYSDDQPSANGIGSGITFAEVPDDPNDDINKWAIYRRVSGNVGDLICTFGKDCKPSHNDKVLQLRQNGNVIMGVSSLGGDLGIGVAYPTERLDVDGTARLRTMPIGAATAVHVSATGVLMRRTSSLRYKTNIRALPSDPSAVLRLRPVGFDWRSTGEPDVGLIAEEVAEVLPELVVRDSTGRPEAVHYDKVAVYLLEVVKKQQKRLAVLEAMVAENRLLQARIEALEEAVNQRSAGAEQNRSVQP